MPTGPPHYVAVPQLTDMIVRLHRSWYLTYSDFVGNLDGFKLRNMCTKLEDDLGVACLQTIAWNLA